MACYTPLRPFIGKTKENGKMNIVYTPRDSRRGVEIKIPCGQCIGCRLERSRQWAIRCVHEASLYEKNCFVTLTYKDECLPKDKSLHVEEWQNFMKRLRKEYGPGIRFYHCGEYGENLGRPHYHGLIFNHDFEDKKLFTIRNENRLYTSEALGKLWTKGFSVIGDVTFESAAYVARYVMKKVTGEQKENFYGNLKPEYTTMSRRPGIGHDWYKKFKGDVYPSDEIIVRGKSVKPPKYYDNLLDKENPTMLKIIKSKRKYSIDEEENDSFRLPVKEKVKLAQISMLNRDFEKGEI